MKKKPIKIGDILTIKHKGLPIKAFVVDIHKNGEVTVAWTEQLTVKGKPEDITLV